MNDEASNNEREKKIKQTKAVNQIHTMNLVIVTTLW